MYQLAFHWQVSIIFETNIFIVNITKFLVDFDKLGLTDNQNPLGDFPSLFARSMGHQAGDMLASYVARYLHYRRRRDLMDQTEPKTKNFANFRIRRETSVIDDEELKQPELPETHQHAFHGGERFVLFLFIYFKIRF